MESVAAVIALALVAALVFFLPYRLIVVTRRARRHGKTLSKTERVAARREALRAVLFGGIAGAVVAAIVTVAYWPDTSHVDACVRSSPSTMFGQGTVAELARQARADYCHATLAGNAAKFGTTAFLIAAPVGFFLMSTIRGRSWSRAAQSSTVLAEARTPVAAGALTCPECSTPYRLADYRWDAIAIYCSACKAPLPRPEAAR
jgi:hypothetical protein